jgi:hypothetical protein
MSPHRSSHTSDREQKRMRSVVEILGSVAAGERIRTVDREEWY